MADLALLEQTLIQTIIELHNVIRRNKQKNCANQSNACNYESPTPSFVAAFDAITRIETRVRENNNGDLNTPHYIDILTRYNALITYAIEFTQPHDESIRPMVSPTPIQSFITADTIQEKINIVKSHIFGYN